MTLVSRKGKMSLPGRPGYLTQTNGHGKGIQYMMELTVVETIHGFNLGNNTLSQDPDNMISWGGVWNASSSYARSLAGINWMKWPLWASVSAVDKLNKQQLKNSMSCSPSIQIKISAISSNNSSAQKRGYNGYISHIILWFYIRDHGEI